jgi:hypothetical protein
MSGLKVNWTRIVVEGSAIVVSILLAFAIDAWWDAHQDRQEEKRILVGLREELESNLKRIEVELSYRNSVIQSIQTIFDASLGRIELQQEQIDRLIGDVTWWTNVEYSRGVVDGLVQGGRLSIIENKDLRDAISELPNRYDVIRESERNDQTTTSTIVVPYLNRNASLTQIANTMASGRPGTGDTPTPPVYPVTDIRDHRGLINDPEFLGILVQEHWNHLETISSYESFKASIEETLQLIAVQLDHGQ